MEKGLASRLVQVGIRTLNQGQREQIKRFDVETHEMATLDIDAVGRDFVGPVYISCDIDPENLQTRIPSSKVRSAFMLLVTVRCFLAIEI